MLTHAAVYVCAVGACINVNTVCMLGQGSFAVFAAWVEGYLVRDMSYN